MLYSNIKDYQDRVKAWKKSITKKNKKQYANKDIRQIMIITKSWCWGKNAQKGCKLGVQSVLPRLCSHYIASNLKIPEGCTHSFCLFAKAQNCCKEFRWIYQLHDQTPYTEFNLYQRIIDILPPKSSYQTHQIYEFTKKAILDRAINETTSNNQLLIKINGKVTCSLFLKRIGKDALAKAFDPKVMHMYIILYTVYIIKYVQFHFNHVQTDGFRVSYAPKDQKIAISVTNNVVMILSGGIVGTGYCNLVKSKTKKVKKEPNDGHAIIHILDEHLKNINIRFYVKNGFNGNIDVEIKSGEYVINLTKYETSSQPISDIKEEEEYDIEYDASLSPSIPPITSYARTSVNNNNNNNNNIQPFIPYPSPLIIPSISIHSYHQYPCCVNDNRFNSTDNPLINQDNSSVNQSFICNDNESVFNLRPTLLSPDAQVPDDAIFPNLDDFPEFTTPYLLLKETQSLPKNRNHNTRKRGRIDENKTTDHDTSRKKRRLNINEDNSPFNCNQSMGYCQHYHKR